MAGTYNNTPLDELQFRRPEVLQYWGGYRADTIHAIIRESPFFDHTSKNGLLWDQASRDATLWDLCLNRERFEARLRAMNGVEYMIHSEPRPSADPATEGPDSGVWVIRKQERRKTDRGEDKITVLGTYYVVGENLYQAPSLHDILGNHLLSATTALSKFMKTASPLPLFTPAVGYTYYPPTTTASATTNAPSNKTTAQSSRDVSAAPSLAKQQQPQQQQQQQQQDPEPPQPPTASTAPASTPQIADPRDTLALMESFQLTLRHGDEFMDENPLRGEPGNFTFSATNAHIRAKAAEAEAAKAKEAEIARKALEARAKAAATPFAAKVKAGEDKPAAAAAAGAGAAAAANATVAAGVTGDVKVKKVRTKEEKAARRRRKLNATSPGSPMTPGTPATPAA